MSDLPYWEDPEPGTGRRSPRADFRSDAARLSLNGPWRFTLSPTADGTGDAFPRPGFDDSGWHSIPVPSHWVLEGHGWPLYTNTAFPFPIDPPRLPDENPTGDYRVMFDLPVGWTAGDAVLRFQGVDSCGTVWLNGVQLGHSKGSRLPFEFAVGSLLRDSGNVLAVRVQRWSSGSYLEDQDMWWLPGIFRDVELLARPAGCIDDFFVHAGYDAGSGSGTLRVDADVPGMVELPELGITTPTGVAVAVETVDPWSAELPRLYRGTLTAGGEVIELVVGFRTVSVTGGRLLVNGAPVLFRGVNRHEHDPDSGRTLDVETMRRDIVMMKQHNINAVRTSHYPPHPEFLRLCDEYGLWVVLECDIETHGGPYAGWEGNPPNEPAWQNALLDRVTRMVERDKNSPSVVVWSMANESGTGSTFDVLESWIRQRDPSRPILYERDPSYRNSDFYSLMYPSQGALESIGGREEETPPGIEPGSEHDERRRALPFLLCEYAHAMGNGPGSLVDYQRILEAHERFCGGFVWEWIDHGLRGRNADGTEYLRHGADIDFRPNGGRFCLDGLLFADRTPSPGLLEYKKAIEPVEIVADLASGIVAIRNKHDLRDLSHLEFGWRLEIDGEPVAAGELSVPHVAARSAVSVSLPAGAKRAARDAAAAANLRAASLGRDRAGEIWLTVSSVLVVGTSWAPAGHEVAWGQARFTAASVVPTPVRPATEASASRLRTAQVYPTDARTGSTDRRDDEIRLGGARFSRRTGALIALGAVPVRGPVLDVWRAPIENDRGQGGRNDVVATWKAVGLDRMLHRTESVRVERDRVIVRGRTAPATQQIALRSTFTWRFDGGDALALTVEIAPEGPWNDTAYGHHAVTLPRIGLRMALPAAYADATWFGTGPQESYPDSRDSCRVGRFESSIDALQCDYPVPQENGNRTATRWLRLLGPGVPALHVFGSSLFDFSARRWTAEALERARHPHDLRDSGHVWVTLDAAQRGIGSASCGPALPDRYEVLPESTRMSLVFSAGD